MNEHDLSGLRARLANISGATVVSPMVTGQQQEQMGFLLAAAASHSPRASRNVTNPVTGQSYFMWGDSGFPTEDDTDWVMI